MICCYHSSETDATGVGCGNTDECLKCQIRVTINKVFKSTNDQKSVPAWISKCKEKRDDAVLLVIDEIGEQK